MNDLGRKARSSYLCKRYCSHQLVKNHFLFSLVHESSFTAKSADRKVLDAITLQSWTLTQTGDFRCQVCGGKCHNRRTCPKVYHRCGICGESGHNSRTCWKLAGVKTTKRGGEDGAGKKVNACGFCKKRD
ncbi:hypothetical protein Rs2_33620 [Raphanus sativus]|nr:hypothetical protein Rs2_33620 [Raphanus sativus]